jgi:hypothetical protein
VRGARVHEQETARAVRVLGHARLEAGLAEQRRLLVTGDAADAHVASFDTRVNRVIRGVVREARWHDLWQHRSRNSQ